MWFLSEVWFIVTLIGFLEFAGFGCASSQNLQNLLRHPQYTEKHLQHYSSYSQHPIRPYDGHSSSRERDDSAPWQRAGAKEHHKMNGYPLKSSSATKRASFVDPSEIPQELLEVREASEHFVRMRSEARCSQPRPQVVCVRDVYPEKEFLPRCTLLHRCGEAAGCCEDDATRCAPRAVQEVALLFYVLRDDHRSSDVERLFFVNHTECECQPKPSSHNVTIINVAPRTEDVAESARNAVDHFPQSDQNRKCRACPSPFCARQLEDGRCTCDCFDRHRPCIRVKRGREALQDADRRCVLAGQCNIPDCDYGSYDPDKGRCPKRPDHDNYKGFENGKRPHPNSRNPNHRWNYFERD